MPTGFSTRPPVSMMTQGMGPRRPKPYWRSRVRPGTSATIASRVPVSTLNSVDLPTLGRPTSATMGSMARAYTAARPRAAALLAFGSFRRRRRFRCGGRGRGWRRGRRRGRRRRLPRGAGRERGHAIGADLAAVGLHQHHVADHHRSVADARAAGLGTGHERAARLVEPVHVALEVTD